MADKPALAPVIELPTLTKAPVVRRCSACRRPGHRMDSSSCPARAHARKSAADPGSLVDRLTQEIEALDTYIADHQLALDTIEQRLSDASRRRSKLVQALEAAHTVDDLFTRKTTP